MASSARLDVVATVAVVAVVVLLASTGTILLRMWRARSTVGRDDGKVLVVGVAANAALFDVREAPQPVAYLPIELHPTARAARHFVVRTVPGGASRVIEVVSNRLSVLAPEAPLAVRSHRELVNSCTQRELSLAAMLAAIAAATTGLAVMSIAALIALELQRRRREVAMRIVLGASARSLLGALSGRSARCWRWAARWARSEREPSRPSWGHPRWSPNGSRLPAVLRQEQPTCCLDAGRSRR